jgi:hypothetical protein
MDLENHPINMSYNQKEIEINSTQENHILKCHSTSTGRRFFIWDRDSEFYLSLERFQRGCIYTFWKGLKIVYHFGIK